MANPVNYIVYVLIDNQEVRVPVSCATPKEAQELVAEILKDIPEEKVGLLRVADSATGYFIRGFS